jgi:hypothetical protein
VTRDDGFGFRLAAAVAIAVAAFGAAARGPAAEARPAPTLFDAADARPRSVVTSADARARADRFSAAAAAFDAAKPPWAVRVVIHPMAGAEIPEGSPEEGPPFHLIVGRGGAVSRTRRLDAGARATPPGAPQSETRDALHVLVLEADAPDPARDLLLRDWWVAATRRLKRTDAVRFVFELPGADAAPPPGFDPARWTATADDLKAAEEIVR